MQGTGFLNGESVLVLTSNITSKKCGGKVSYLQYEGCKLYTPTTLSNNSIAGGMPVYRVDLLMRPNNRELSDDPADIWVKQLQYPGLIKALAKSYLGRDRVSTSC